MKWLTSKSMSIIAFVLDNIIQDIVTQNGKQHDFSIHAGEIDIYVSDSKNYPLKSYHIKDLLQKEFI